MFLLLNSLNTKNINKIKDTIPAIVIKLTNIPILAQASDSLFEFAKTIFGNINKLEKRLTKDTE